MEKVIPLKKHVNELGDFTTTPRLLTVSALAIVGVITRKDIQRIQERSMTVGEAMQTKIVTAFPDEPLRLVVYRMAETGLTRMPVVDRDDPNKLVGMISLTDLLRARTRNLEEERRRERVLRLRLFPLQLKVAARR
jgi:chloride channel protein, CIC family